MSRYNTIKVIGGTVYVGTVTISGASIDNKVGIDEDVFKIGDSWRSLKEDHAGNMNRDVSADGVTTWYIIVIANVFRLNVLFYVTPHFFLHRASELWPSELWVRGRVSLYLPRTIPHPATDADGGHGCWRSHLWSRNQSDPSGSRKDIPHRNNW